MSKKKPTDIPDSTADELLELNTQIKSLQKKIDLINKELLDEKLRHKALFEMRNDAVFLIDKDGKYLDVNSFAVEKFGYTLKEFKKLHAQNLLSKSETAKYTDRWEQLWEGKEYPIYERIFRKKNGELFPAEVSVKMVTDEDGNKLYIQSIIRDISVRKSIEDTIEAERSIFKIIADALSKQTTIEDFCIEFLTNLQKIMPFDFGCISTLNSDRTILELRGSKGDIPAEGTLIMSNISMSDKENPIVKLLSKREFIEKYNPLTGNKGIESVIVSPLLGKNNEPVGVFQTFSQEEMNLSKGEETFFSSIIGILASAIDKFLAEERLARSYKEREELNRIISMSSAIVILWKKESGWPIEYISDNVKTQWGYTPEEFYSKQVTYYEIIPEDDARRVDFEVANFSQSAGLDSYVVEYRVYTKNKDLRWVREFTTMRRDNDGKITHYRSILIDDTERKKIEEKQLKEREIFQIVAEATLYSPDIESLASKILAGIMKSFGFDVGTIRLYDSKEETLVPIADIGAKRWLSDNAAKPISIHISDYFVAHVARTRKPIFAPDTSKAAFNKKHIERLKKIKVKSQIAWPILNSKQELLGTFIIGAYSAKNIEELDILLFETLADMLSSAIEQKLTEQALKDREKELKNLNEKLEDRVDVRTIELQKKIAELEEFSYAISHDLRTPLRGINGITALLNDEYSSIFDDQAKEYLNRIRFATSKMGLLIDDLLDLSNVSSWELKLQQLNLGKYAEMVFKYVMENYPGHSLKLRARKDVVVMADSRLIRILLFNLLDNAVKFSLNTENPKITFGARKKGNQYVFYVKDTGIGFDMKFEEKIYQPFQRLHAAEEYRGYGIGLATVSRILEKHKGRIWAESEIGIGSTFYFTLNENDN